MKKYAPYIILILVGVLIVGKLLIDSRKVNEQAVRDTQDVDISIAPTEKSEEILTPPVAAMNDKKTMAKVTELKIEDTKIGTGPEVKSGDTVVMNYKGTLLDGTKFDSSYDRTTPFETQIGVGRVIQGWDKGIPGMKVGGKRKLTIPSDMAYGSQGAGGVIPPNADLIFEVELLTIK